MQAHNQHMYIHKHKYIIEYSLYSLVQRYEGMAIDGEFDSSRRMRTTPPGYTQYTYVSRQMHLAYMNTLFYSNVSRFLSTTNTFTWKRQLLLLITKHTVSIRQNSIIR